MAAEFVIQAMVVGYTVLCGTVHWWNADNSNFNANILYWFCYHVFGCCRVIHAKIHHLLSSILPGNFQHLLLCTKWRNSFFYHLYVFLNLKFWIFPLLLVISSKALNIFFQFLLSVRLMKMVLFVCGSFTIRVLKSANFAYSERALDVALDMEI